MSHEMKQFVIDGNKCVLNRPAPEAKVEDHEFEEHEVSVDADTLLYLFLGFFCLQANIAGHMGAWP